MYNFYNGFPTPGPQTTNLREVTNKIFFSTRDEWDYITKYGDYDFVVIGSGFCSLAFVDRVLKNDPDKKILVLEKGDFFLPEHFQNLPPVFSSTLPNQVVKTELFPWTLSQSTYNLPYANWSHGMVPFFGGRSVLWSSWCPRPTTEELIREKWPGEIQEMMTDEFFKDAEELLSVKSTKRICNNIFAILQRKIKKNLDGAISSGNLSMEQCLYAPLAIGDKYNIRSDFTKYSVVPDFLDLVIKDINDCKDKIEDRRVVVVTNCTVNRIVSQKSDCNNQTALALETNRGVVPLVRPKKDDAKVILAVGCMPAATLLLNSFEFPDEEKRPGKTFGAHFITASTARIPRSHFQSVKDTKLELGAIYLSNSSEETGKGWHHQVSIISVGCLDETSTAHYYMPDVVATASLEQLEGSEEYVILVFATLGEMDIDNPDNWLRKNNSSDIGSNVTLQWILNDNDMLLWNEMEQSILDVSIQVAGDAPLEFWNYTNNKWETNTEKKIIPNGNDPRFLRVDGMVHESSLMPLGQVVKPDFSLEENIDGVYVTGSGLWPSAGHWNPTMTMSGFAQVLADNLTNDKEE